jgi:hypothetical protein
MHPLLACEELLGNTFHVRVRVYWIKNVHLRLALQGRTVDEPLDRAKYPLDRRPEVLAAVARQEDEVDVALLVVDAVCAIAAICPSIYGLEQI